MLRAVAIALALVACRDPEVDRLASIRNEVCACKTPACIQTALARLPRQQEATSTPRTQAVAREILDCIAKQKEAADAADDPPPAPAPAPAGSGMGSAATAGSAG